MKNKKKVTLITSPH